MSRWTSGRVVVAVEVACGLAIAGYFSYLGIAAEVEGLPGRSWIDRGLPFGLAVAALVSVVVLSPRRWRRAGSSSAPSAPPDRSRHTLPNARRDVVRAPRVPPEPPELSGPGRRELARVVAVLARTGLFAPRVPDPADLEEAVADAGEPVTADTVLAALDEAEYWHPGFRREEYGAAVAFDHWAGEQVPETVRAQVADLARLTGGDLAVELADLRLDEDGVAVRVRMTLLLGGREEALSYRGAPKRLSTVPHVAVARALPRTSGRMAWLPHDQGVWIAVLRGGATVDALNAELGITGPDAWEWVDEQEPLVAGDLYR